MPLLIFDEKSFELTIRCKPEETFAPDEEVKQLVSEFDGIRRDYLAINQRLSQLLPKCTAWSRKHDESLDAKLRKKEESLKPKEPEDASTAGEAQV